MSAGTQSSRILYDSDLGPVLKQVKRDAELATEAVDKYRQTVRRVAETSTPANDVYRPAFQTVRQRAGRKSEDIFSPIAPGNAFTVVSILNELGKLLPHTQRLVGTLSRVTAALAPLLLFKKYLDKDFGPKRPPSAINTELIDKFDKIDTFLTVASSLATLAAAGSGSTIPLLATIGAIGTAASLPLLLASVGVAALVYTAERKSDEELARRRESEVLAEERRRTVPQHTKVKLEDYALGRENSLRTAYESLRKYDHLVTELTGQNVDDLLKGLQDLNPRALESYFQSLREGRGEIEQLSQTQLAHIDLIEQLVVTYRALAVESDAARDAASEYADHLRPVDVIFETLAVHAGALTAQFVEQHGALQRHTQATEAQAQAARDVAAATTAQAAATERANTGEVARTRNLLRTTQHTRAASGQIASATERLIDLTGALMTTDAGLATHSEHVGYVTEAYRELSAQIGDTIGDVLSGAVSFKEAWESLGRGVLDTVKHLGRQLLDSLLGSVRDVGRRLADVIFGQLQGALGSFGLGASRGFLPPFLGDDLFHSGGLAESCQPSVRRL